MFNGPVKQKYLAPTKTLLLRGERVKPLLELSVDFPGRYNKV